MDSNKIIEDIILSQKDFELLPRDEDGYCVYDGDLIIPTENIKTLPTKLRVLGFLDCSYNQLTSLPDGLYIDGYLNCSHNQLTSLSNELKFNGSLDCSYNQLTSLPDKLKVIGYLDCGNNQLKWLPDSIIIKGVLYCSHNQITTEIKCQIGGLIYMDNEQKKQYLRAIKINKIKDNIDG